LILVVLAYGFDENILEAGKSFGEVNYAAMAIVMLNDGRPFRGCGFEDQARNGPFIP
jgi:hypothetical protein